ncbi:MAG: adenosylcobinamide-phosphate synthase CbiB [Lachnospiraceae bacterium]|nr:adenosylcobinamide-phosphate synthase CbiB [Lachnospiraceae bacterium]
MIFTIGLITYTISFITDLILGDPSCIPHPVVFFGKLIGFLEKPYRNLFKGKKSGNKKAGILMVITVLLIILSVISAIYSLLFFSKNRFLLILLLILDTFLGYQSIAIRDMLKESTSVYNALKIYEDDHRYSSLNSARIAVGRIVGRDTDRLSEDDIIRACVETVSENFSDGVVAPMLYYAAFGAPGALLYKAVNTMDSMVGYKNERFIDYGSCAARLDDILNFIPSRIASVILILSCGMGPMGIKNAFRIWKRDRLNHSSPNSGQTEAVMAGALGIRLGGGSFYFGEYYEKPYIGDDTRNAVIGDIITANYTFLLGSFLCLFAGLLLRGITAFLFIMIILKKG